MVVYLYLHCQLWNNWIVGSCSSRVFCRSSWGIVWQVLSPKPRSVWKTKQSMDIIYNWRTRFCGQTLPYFRNRRKRGGGAINFPWLFFQHEHSFVFIFFTQWIRTGNNRGRSDGQTDRKTERRSKRMVVITFEYCPYVLYCFVFIRNNSLSIQSACIEGSRTPTISSIDKVTCLSFNFHPLVTPMELY